MGYSTSGTVVILFIGVLLSLSAVVPAVEATVDNVTDALDNQNDRLIDAQNTDINLTNVTYDTSTDVVTVTANNTGTTALSVSSTDVLVDGNIAVNATTSVEGNVQRELWAPGETLRVRVENVTSTPDRVQLTTEHGISRATDKIEVI